MSQVTQVPPQAFELDGHNGVRIRVGHP
jgi:hypothetical protein